jgi:WhiB family redox-sensing transcriptional regulator
VSGEFRLGMADTRAPDELSSGLCSQDDDPDLWFPERVPSRERRAVGICNRCPVQAACLDYALSVPWLRGVWGGTTEQERQAMRRLR